MRPLTTSLALLLLSACSSAWGPVDVDGDGYTLATGDCWDNEVGPQGMASGDIHPGASETWYDGFDQDCDGGNDFDQDGDGHASVDYPDPTGVLPSDDCWDDPTTVPEGFAADDPGEQPDAAEVYPGAVEVWYDGVDQDCGGEDDYDQDGDGFASMANVEGGEDCFDAATDDFENGGGLDPAEVNPDAEETWYDGTDADCAGDDDFDQDRDGWPIDEECDDEDATRFPDPSIPETWYDGIDDNCDGNDGDQDGDGYYAADYAFEVPATYEPGDCWDDPADGAAWDPLNGFEPLAPADVHPGAAETWYDGLDQDCAGGGDFDQDGDGYAVDAYADAGGVVGDDCDDASPGVNPAADEEWYDGIDQDCDGGNDFDQDGDGYANDTDCQDEDVTINPGALEECGDSVDEDCSGSDNDADALGCSAYYADVDGDGFGGDTTACLCEPEGIYMEVESGDCDDGDGAVNPDQVETCETAADDDCDGDANAVDAAGCTDWFADADGDGYGGESSQCACEADTAFPADASDDCDDGDEDVNPGAAEQCNDADDDCDSSVDEGLTLYYVDADEDGYGDEGAAGDCAASATGVADNTDCDDTLPTVYPTAPELCDGAYNDCDAAGTWTESDEDDLVAFVDTDGDWSDVSSSFTSTTAATYQLQSGNYYFCAGHYYVKFVASSDTTTIEALYGATETTVENNTASGSTLAVTNGNVTFSGFTVVGGPGSGTGTTYGGGIIGSVTGTTAPTSPHLTVEDCVVTGGDATRGGGVSSYSLGWVKLVRTTVEGNTATDGGGIYISTTADMTIEDSTIQDNVAATDGGGIYLDDGTLTMTGTAIIDNTSGDDGGGLFIDTGTATCTSGDIYGNTAGTSSHGGGVYLSNYASTTASFTSVGCDFGTGATDNSPNDVTVKSAASSYVDYASYSSTASFICSNATDMCTP